MQKDALNERSGKPLSYTWAHDKVPSEWMCCK